LSFWDKLDEIGIDGYFPLANSDQSPTVRELEYSWTHGSVASWVNTALGGKSPLDYLHDLSAEYHKHVEFTEVGYRAIDGAATSPGDFAMDGTLDATAQANLYKALFDTFGSQGGHWFDGFYLWERRADNYSEPKDYHTEGRAAQAVIDKWYGMDNKGGHAPSTKMTLAGTLDNDTLMGGIGGTTILGGDGNDTITGGGGNDTIIGGDRETHVGTHSVVGLTAYCDSMNGVGAQFDVFLNGKRIGQDETSSAHSEAWQIGHYAFDAATPSDFKSLKIVFTNDDFGGGQDRNLYVTSISINGITIDLKNAINTQQPHSGTLYSDGSFSVDLRSLSSSLTPATTDDDVLRGGLGHDRLTGGAGDDIFVYKSLAEIAGDVITDFHPGHDLIDLHRIDANSHQNASQAFDWIGNHDFSHHAGELSERMDGANTVVLGDVDGDGRADFKLVLSGHLTLHNSDFVL
jgi:Ca2+-binding RTX toxin-like protein